MYVDLHNHYLPAVDDGVKDIEETLSGLRNAVSENVSVVCFTPHIWEGRFPNEPGWLREMFDFVKQKAAGIPVELHLASEVYYGSSLAEDYAAGRYIPMGKRKKYLLVELSTSVLPKGVNNGFYNLMLQGAEPILAHPERYSYVQKDIKCLFELAQLQIPFQVTTQSVTGAHGSRAEAAAIKLLDNGMVSFLASDAHHPENRPLLFREAVRIVNKRYGHTAARLLSVENPRRILEGGPPVPVPGKRGKLSPFA